MAIKKTVVITCDGPCGSTVSDRSVPKGWIRVNFQLTGLDGNVDSTVGRSFFCPSCISKLEYLFAKSGFSVEIFNDKRTLVPEPVKSA